MTHCPNCGTPIEPGGKFCPSCGTKAVEATSTPAPSPTEPRPAAGSPHMPAPKAREATRPKAPSAPSRPSSSGAVGSVRSTGSPSSSAPVVLFPYDVERNRRYFVPPSIKTEIIVIIVAVIVLFTGFSMGGKSGGLGPMLIIGALIAGVLAGLSIRFKRDCPTDAEVDAMYEDIAQIGGDEAVKKLGISSKEAQRVSPLAFSGRNWADDPAKVFMRVGKDGVARTSNYQVSFLYPGREALYCYAASQSLTIKTRRVKTADVFYEDVVDMSITETVSSSGGSGGFFTMHLSSGAPYEFAFSASQRASVEGLRTLLREKKAEAGKLQREQLKTIKAQM